MNDAAFRRVELVRVLTNAETPLSSDKLGSRFGVNRRTIEKDIVKLEDLGYKFERSFGPGGGYKAIKPVPELDYIICENDTENALQFERFRNAPEYQDEAAQRFLNYVRTIMIDRVFQ